MDEKEHRREIIAGRAVYPTREHGELDLPAELIFRGDQLLLDEAVRESGYVTVSLRAGRFRLRTTSWVGLIPLNNAIAIEVEPRVPIRALDALLASISEARQRTILLGQQAYAEGAFSPPNLLDLIADRIVQIAKVIHLIGLDFVYLPSQVSGPHPVGTLLPFETKLRQAIVHDPAQSVSRTWRRSFDTQGNRIVLAVIRHLQNLYGSTSRRKGARKLGSQLAEAAAIFSRVTVRDWNLEREALSPLPRRISCRAEYVEAHALARAIFGGQGISLQAKGALNLQPIVVNLEDAFEAYFRTNLARELSSYGFQALDGRLAYPEGMKANLYSQAATAEIAAIDAKPDIVIAAGGVPQAVIDVKYRPYSGGPPVRADVDQIITYAAVYGARKALIAVPERPNGMPNILPIGKIGPTDVSVVMVDLNAENLTEELGLTAKALADYLTKSLE